MHRLRIVTAHVDRVVRLGASDVARSQRELAEALATPAIANVHPALLGMIF